MNTASLVYLAKPIQFTEEQFAQISKVTALVTGMKHPRNSESQCRREPHPLDVSHILEKRCYPN